MGNGALHAYAQAAILEQKIAEKYSKFGSG